MVSEKNRRRIEAAHGVRIDYHEELSSTNDRAAGAEYSHRDVVWAETQRSGRGQRGNSWSSRAGENLTFSLVVRPENLPAEQQFYLSKIVSLALTEALARFDVTVEVKWPNDIYVGDRKIAGILIENDLQGAYITKSVIGIGLNVNQMEFDPALPNPTSLALEAGGAVDRTAVLEAIFERFFEWEGRLQLGDFAAIDSTYRESLYRREGDHLFQEPDGGAFTASIAAVQPSGELVLQKADGTRKSYLFKEVEFVI